MTKAVNKFLSSTQTDLKTYFVTLPPSKVMHSLNEPESFMQKILQAYRRDMLLLEQLQYDKRFLLFSFCLALKSFRFQKCIGVPAFCKQIISHTWKAYQENMPSVLKHLRQKKQEAAKALEQQQHEAESLDASYLRGIATNYIVEFLKVPSWDVYLLCLQITERLLSGTAEGNPSISGQTLEQEKGQCGGTSFTPFLYLSHAAAAQWVDAGGLPIMVYPEEWKIPYWQNKLYGGQQFERLLAGGA